MSGRGAISKVDFVIDGTPFSVERDAAYDLARTRSNGRAYGFDTTLLTNGEQTIVATVTYTRTGSTPTVAKATVRVHNGARSRSILVSTRTDRGAPVQLDGASVHGKVAIFVGPTAPIDGGVVRFAIDARVQSTETLIACDLATTATDGTARLFDLKTPKEGVHTVTAEILLPSGISITQTARFTVS